MKIKNLLLMGGIINILFLLFHLYLGYLMTSWPGLNPQLLALLETFNMIGAFMIFMIAWNSLINRDEMLSTKTGKTWAVLAALVYLSRAAAEALVFPKFNVVIFSVCVLVGALYAYLLFAKPAE